MSACGLRGANRRDQENLQTKNKQYLNYKQERVMNYIFHTYFS